LRELWEDNIKMDLGEVCGSVDWIKVAHKRVQWLGFANSVIDVWVRWKQEML